jgi:dTDP-4-dehydrorhamnose reductase
MRIVLTGGSGQLGAYLLDRLDPSGDSLFAWSGSVAQSFKGRLFERVDLANREAIERRLDEIKPDAVIHLGAVSVAEAVRRDPAVARKVNVDATRQIAEWCDRHGRRLVFTSTDMVFDGSKSWWSESDSPNPVLEYGRTKVAAEEAVLGMGNGLIVRLSLLFGASHNGRESFFDRALATLRRGETQSFFADEFRTPLHLSKAAEALELLLRMDTTGIVHVGGEERLSRYELMRQSAKALGIDASLVLANHRADFPGSEPRPADLSLDTSKLAELLPEFQRTGVRDALLVG